MLRIKKIVGNLILPVLLMGSCNNAFCDPNTIETQEKTTKSVNDLKDFLQQNILNHDTRDAELMFQVAPGRLTGAPNDVQKQVADNIKVMDPAINPGIITQEAMQNFQRDMILWNLNESVVNNGPIPWFWPQISSNINLVKAVAGHNAYFCSQNSTLDTFIGCSGSGSINQEFGDLKINSVISPMAYDTSSYPIESAMSVIKNVVDPIQSEFNLKVIGKLKANWNSNKTFADNFNKKRYNAYMQMMSAEAGLSVARQSFLEMMVSRIKNTTTNKSIMEVMRDGASNRYQDQAWQDNLSVASPAAISRELAQMAAFNLWSNFKSYQQQERIEALLATSLSFQIRIAQALAELGMQVPNP